MPQKKKENKEDKAWRKSEAKRLLAKDIIDGTIPEDMAWTEVHNWRPEYALSSYTLFASRLRNLCAQISAAKARAERDEQGLATDRLSFPVSLYDSNGSLRWDGSAAQAWLVKDMEAGMHTEMKPRQLYQSRPCYQAFALDIFRGHIYQQVRRQKYCTWRNESGKPKANEWM